MGQSTPKNNLSGKAMSPSMATLLEREMQEDLANFKSANPDILKIKTNEKPIGKVMIVGTGGDLNTNGFENIWKNKFK